MFDFVNSYIKLYCKGLRWVLVYVAFFTTTIVYSQNETDSADGLMAAAGEEPGNVVRLEGEALAEVLATGATVDVPEGQTLVIVLPDGGQMTLGSGASVSLSLNASGAPRIAVSAGTALYSPPTPASPTDTGATEGTTVAASAIEIEIDGITVEATGASLVVSVSSEGSAISNLSTEGTVTVNDAPVAGGDGGTLSGGTFQSDPIVAESLKAEATSLQTVSTTGTSTTPIIVEADAEEETSDGEAETTEEAVDADSAEEPAAEEAPEPTADESPADDTNTAPEETLSVTEQEAPPPEPAPTVAETGSVTANADSTETGVQEVSPTGTPPPTLTPTQQTQTPPTETVAPPPPPPAIILPPTIDQSEFNTISPS